LLVKNKARLHLCIPKKKDAIYSCPTLSGAICRCEGGAAIGRGRRWRFGGIPVSLGARGGVRAGRRSAYLENAVLVVGVVGIRGLEEVEFGVAMVVGDDAALELGPVLDDEGSGLFDDDADVGRRVDDADGARVGGHRRRGIRLRARRGRLRRRLLQLLVVVDAGAHGGGHEREEGRARVQRAVTPGPGMGRRQRRRIGNMYIWAGFGSSRYRHALTDMYIWARFFWT